MNDTQAIIDALTAALLERLGDEVDLIFRYGSQLTGATNRYSDVDLSYVPVHEDTWESITVLVDETLFDLYPMHWSKLERMAAFREVSASVLLNHRIIYRRTDAAEQRMQALANQLRACLEPEARPEMIRRALEIFQSTGYDYYLLHEQAETGHGAGSLKQAQAIFRTVLHCLAVINQACVDTRKLVQVLALPRLPVDFAATAGRMVDATEPRDLLAATDALLQTTRALLLAEQRGHLHQEIPYPAAFDAAYPELKRDLQGVMLACERQDMFALKTSLFSLLHEMSLGIAQVGTGVAYSRFNGLADYEQDLAALGFPDLLSYIEMRDFEQLRQQCLVFDQRLKQFLAEHSVQLNAFATLDELHNSIVTATA
jgi:hypothetical protein